VRLGFYISVEDAEDRSDRSEWGTPFSLIPRS